MLAVLVAKTSADAIEASSIYDLVLNFSQLPYLDAKVEVSHCARPVDVMDSDTPVIHLDEENTLASLKHKVIETEHSALAQGFPVLRPVNETSDSRLVGYIGLKELAVALSSKAHHDADTPVRFDKQLELDQSAITPGFCDLGYLMDASPIVVTLRSPM